MIWEFSKSDSVWRRCINYRFLEKIKKYYVVSISKKWEVYLFFRLYGCIHKWLHTKRGGANCYMTTWHNAADAIRTSHIFYRAFVYFFACLSFFRFVKEKEGNICFSAKKWFSPANGDWSTRSLAKIHNSYMQAVS